MTTEERKAQSKEKRQRLTGFIKAIAKMTTQERQTIVDRIGTIPTCEAHPLSISNTCLLYLQAGMGVTMIGGFQQWRRQGRQVRKGEHGYGIWVPIGHKDKAESESESRETDSQDRTTFIFATVFDISQTDPITQEIEAT